MTIIQRFGICLLVLVFYGMLTYLMPDSLEPWKRGAFQIFLTSGMFLFLMFPPTTQKS